MHWRSRFATLAALGLAIFTTSSRSAEADMAAKAQAELQRVAPADGPGLVVLVAKGDAVLFRGARGRADMELNVSLAPDQVFRIASITKMFTAATVIRLSQLGKLSLDDTLATYLPEFPNASHITLRELLNHTAGISDVPQDVVPGLTRRNLDTATLLADIRKRKPAFAPGTRWDYSNAGYALLGGVIEKVTDETWHAAVQRLVIVPAGLTRTLYGEGADVVPGRVDGYTTDNPQHRVEVPSYINLSFPAAAGGLISTADDLHHWMRALATGKVVGLDGFRQMITPVTDLPGVSPMHRYGLGTYVWQVRGQTMIGHTGQINGFAACVGYLPVQDITVVVLANDDAFDARTMGRRLAALALGQPYATVDSVAAPPERLQSLQGRYRIDEGTLETLTVEDGKLYAQRGSRHKTPMQMDAAGRLYFVPDELSYFVPVSDSTGRVVRLDYFNGGDAPATPYPRVPPEGHDTDL